VAFYFQIVEIIEYQIATGKIKKGERFPSVRDSADLWHVNMHTVRHDSRGFRALDAEGNDFSLAAAS